MIKIGVVEDDSVLAGEIVYFLNANGYDATVVTAENYTVEGLTGCGYQMLLLDIGLPGTDGLYLCREIRKERIVLRQ